MRALPTLATINDASIALVARHRRNVTIRQRVTFLVDCIEPKGLEYVQRRRSGGPSGAAATVEKFGEEMCNDQDEDCESKQEHRTCCRVRADDLGNPICDRSSLCLDRLAGDPCCTEPDPGRDHSRWTARIDCSLSSVGRILI